MGDTYDFSRAHIERSTINIQSTIQQLSAVQVLHQLPAPAADFTGREKELAELEAAIVEGAVAISGIRGMGGVGKTALALVLAQRLCDRYPDAQIYLDLQGTSGDPLTPADAMAHVIRAFQRDARLPDSQAELAAMYRSLLHGKRVLLLIDNAAGRAQVEPLIGPPGCVLLLTSRRRFTLPGLRALNLDALPEGDARALLLRICARIGSAVGDLARACSCLPLALRVAGSALEEREDLPVEVYLDRLRRGRERFPEVDASLNVSYELLTDHLQRIWRLLAVFPAAFDALGAQAVLDVEPDDAQDALSELVRYSLVQWDSDAERYNLHDLARDFAHHRQTKQERGQAARRHAVHYALVLAVGDHLYLEGGRGVLSGLRLFDLERHNIEAGQKWAVARLHEDEQAASLCSAYANAGTYCLNLRLHPAERILWLEAAANACRSAGDRRGMAGHLGNLGRAYSALGDVPRAIEHYEQALAISREIGDRRGEGTWLGNLGSAYNDLGEGGRAIEHYEQALAVAREIGDRRGEGARLGNVGLAYSDLGEVGQAIEHYEQALAIAREIGDRRAEGADLGNLGKAYHLLGDVPQAIEHYRQALAISREIGDRRGEGADLGNLGSAYSDLGEVVRAIEHYEQALAIAREIGDRRGEGADLGNLGKAYYLLGDVRRAIEHYEQALAVAREIGDRRNEGSWLGNLGLAYSALGDVGRAIEHYEQALAIAREVGDRRGEGTWLGNLGSAYSDLGDARRAIEYHEQLLAIAREIGDRRAEGADLGNLGLAYSDLGDVGRAIEHYEQALAIAREVDDRRAEGTWLGNLGSAYSTLGEVQRAIDYYEQALSIAREIGDRRGEAFRSWNLGLLYQDTDPRRAAELMQVCVDYECEIGHPNAEAHAAHVVQLRQRINDNPHETE
jgi:tetratricopeptide (TPR) repeat protein